MLVIWSLITAMALLSNLLKRLLPRHAEELLSGEFARRFSTAGHFARDRLQQLIERGRDAVDSAQANDFAVEEIGLDGSLRPGHTLPA